MHNDQHHSVNGMVVAVIAFFIIIIAATVGYNSWQEKSESFVAPDVSTMVKGGSVQLLGGPQPQAPNQQVQSAVTEQPSVTESLAKIPYSMNIPSGWKETAYEERVNNCTGSTGIESSQRTYTKGSQTLRVFENESPLGCEGEAVADLYLDFDFSADETSINPNVDVDLSLCTKEQNPACPKGDGKISLVIGNESAPNEPIKNTISLSYYYFAIDDTNLEPDQRAQIKNLAAFTSYFAL